MVGRREANKAKTRAAMIEAGIRLMFQHGYNGASTTAIAKAAGVSPATLFNYFPTKASLVFADDDLWAAPVGPPTPGPTPRATLGRVIVDLLDQPQWTRPAHDELTRMRFELVRREPVLRQEQVARAFCRVPEFARLARAAHPELDQDSALAEAGAVVGAVLAAMLWSDSLDIGHLVREAAAPHFDAAGTVPAPCVMTGSITRRPHDGPL